MKRGILTIHKNNVTLSGNVWMTDYEITDLFRVTFSAVNSQIKAVYKSGALKEYDTYQYIRLENGNRADAYNLEMITALAFRLNSLPAKIFRQWVIKKAATPVRSHPPIVLQLKNGYPC